MAKFYLNMEIKGATEVLAYQIDEETYDDLNVDEELDEDDAIDIQDSFDVTHSEVVMTYDDLADCETFSLIVKDEDDNIVYKSHDATEFPLYWFSKYANKAYKYNEEEEEEDEDEEEKEYDLPNFTFSNLEEGHYMIENNDLKWATWEAEFEAEEFDPSKLAFYPSAFFDDSLCEDDVYLSCLRYDTQMLYLDSDWGDNYGSNFKLLTKEKNGWSDHH